VPEEPTIGSLTIELAYAKSVLKIIFREYKQYLKRTQAAPHFIEERRALVESVLKEKK
jgi:hypothetical protein